MSLTGGHVPHEPVVRLAAGDRDRHVAMVPLGTDAGGAVPGWSSVIGRTRKTVEMTYRILADLSAIGWVSYMRTATTRPEATVMAAAAQIAARTPQRSAVMPPTTAPAA